MARARASKLCARYTSPTTIGQQISISASVRNQDDGSNFLVSRERTRGCLVSLVCLPSSPWSLTRRLARLMAAVIGSGCNSCPFLPPSPPYSLSFRSTAERGAEGRRKQVCFRVIAAVAVVFALVLVRISCVKLVLLLHRPRRCCRQKRYLRREIPKRRPHLMKELCGSYHCLIAIRTNTLSCH